MKLTTYIDKLHAFSSSPKMAEAKQEIIRRGLQLIAGEFGTESDPYGRNWKPTKQKNRILWKTGALASSFTGFATTNGVVFRSSSDYAVYQQGKRAMLPKSSRGLGRQWTENGAGCVAPENARGATSMSGALKTLYATLQGAPSLVNATVLFGEENINAQDVTLPYVCMVPTGGPWENAVDAPGYYRSADVELHNIWMTQESIDLYLWAADTDPSAQPIDHADAVETFRQEVLQALQYQVAYGDVNGVKHRGFKFNPVSGRWAQMQQASVRYGRAYVLTVKVDITAIDVLPVNANPPLALELNPSLDA